jgi:hypothetical protein
MKNTLFLLLVISKLFFSCESNNEITHPLTVKGMRLGLKLDDQTNIAIKKGICDNKIGTFDLIRFDFDNSTNGIIPIQQNENNCQYWLNDDIIIKPKSFYGFLNGEKILSSVTLLFHSPTKYRFVSTIWADEGELENGRPSVSWAQALEICSMYEKKYGKGKGGNTKKWIKGDLCITLKIMEYFDLKEKDVCLCVVSYEYVKEKRDKIIFEDLENSSI